MNRWLRAMNPFLAPRGMAEAQRSARALGIGLALSVVIGFGPMAWMMMSGWFDTLMSAQYAQMGLSAEDIAMQQAIMDAVWPFVIGFGVVASVVLYGVLGWVQWRYMTRAIPIILLALQVYGAFSSIVIQKVGTIPIPDTPPWLTAVMWIGSAVLVVIYAASLRGAMALHKLRSQP